MVLDLASSGGVQREVSKMAAEYYLGKEEFHVGQAF
jgi:hypothetical protein